MNLRLRQGLYLGVRGCGLFTWSRWWHRHQTVILTYHAISTGSTNGGRHRFALAAEAFERQLAHLSRHYRVIALAELIRRLNAKAALPPYTAVITLEDGLRSQAAVAAHLLQKYRLPATMFLTTAFIGTQQLGLWTDRLDWLVQSAHASSVDFDFDGDARSLALRSVRDRIIASDLLRTYLKKLPQRQREENMARLAQKVGGTHATQAYERDGYLSWEELRRLRSGLMDFGSHTHTRALMSTLSPAEAHFELAESRRLIQTELDCACELFSYPSDSSAGARDKDLLKNLGFKAALSRRGGFNAPRTDVYNLRRSHVFRCPDFNFFLAKMSGAGPWFKPRF